MDLPIRGSCQCGSITYRVNDEPLITSVCHCGDCQKLSSSAFSLSTIIRRDSLEITSGELKSWERPTEAGGTAVCWFCPDCGNRVFHENPAMPEFIRLKPGGVEDTSVLDPKVQVWTSRQHAWLEHLVELPAFETQPDIGKAVAALARGESPF